MKSTPGTTRIQILFLTLPSRYPSKPYCTSIGNSFFWLYRNIKSLFMCGYYYARKKKSYKVKRFCANLNIFKKNRRRLCLNENAVCPKLMWAGDVLSLYEASGILEYRAVISKYLLKQKLIDMVTVLISSQKSCVRSCIITVCVRFWT